MSDEVVTKLVIDADVSGGDQFTQAMDKAGSSAESGMSSVQGMTLAIAGVSAATVAAIVGLRAFVDYVGNQSQALVDMANHAELAGMNVKEFQQTLFAAMSAGVGEKDFASGLDKITADLTDASRGATMFGKVFEQNGIAIKDQNGALITTKQAVTDLADLMARATPQQAQALAKIVGISQSWIPFLKQGSESIEEQKQKAADLGIIIGDSTIDKAKEFNTQWKTAVAAWDLQFKASMASILPLLTQLANMATSIIDAIGSVSSTAVRLMTPDDQKTTSQIKDQIADVERLTEMMQKFGEQDLRSTNKKGMLGLPEDADIQKVDHYLDDLMDRYDQLNARIRVTAAPGAGITLPALNDSNDPVDRAINTLRRHAEQMEADTAAVGLGEAALAKFRAEAQESSAVQANQNKETDKQSDAFQDLQLEIEAAAGALAKAKINNTVNFGSQTALLTPQDVQIATQLKGIYPDVTTALNSTEAAQLRYNAAVKDGAQAFQTSANPALVDFEMGTKSGSDAIKAFEQQFVKSILTMINQLLIFGPMMKALQTGFTGFNLFGSAAAVASAQGNVFSAGRVVPFALGGIPDIVDSPTMAPMALFGEGGNPEAIMPLKRGPDGSLGVASAGKSGGDEHHYYIDARGADTAAIARLQRGLVQLQAAQRSQGAAMTSMQYFNATGVNR